MPTATPTRPWAKLYDKRSWRRRARMQLRISPLCEWCLKKTPSVVTPATQAHHVEAHRGSINSFTTGALASICDACHAVVTASEQRGFDTAVGVDGYPLDPNYPVYTGSLK